MIAGNVEVQCPACGVTQECQLVQSLNTEKNPDVKQRLLRGEVNLLVCACGRRTPLAANVLFFDPVADYICQVCPGGDAAVAQAAEAFKSAGATGRQRIVPSLNALVEKVMMLDAGLHDWALEMAKVLLLASLPAPDLDRILLFDRLDGELLRWVMIEEGIAHPVSSARAVYDRLAARADYPPPLSELQIDRAWAVEAVRRLVHSTN